jgi:HEAT repeat protein
LSSSGAVRMSLRPASLALVLLAPLALALPPSAQKRLRNRAEVDAQLEQLVAGAPVPTTISRLQYAHEEEYTAEQIQLLMRKAVDERTRRNLTAVLAALGARGAEPLLARLASDGDSPVRMYAAQGLGKLRSRRVEVLTPLLEDKSMGVRKEAAKALGLSGNPRVGKTLLALARTEPEPEVRAELLVAVGRSGDARQAATLKEFLSSDSESTRFAAARGLCHLGAPEGFAFANKLLGAQDRFVRRQGLELYEGVSAQKARASLRPLLEDPDRSLAAGSARILHQGGEPKMLDWLVLASFHAKGDEKLSYEKELEVLRLADDQRSAILRKAGVLK